MKQQHHGELTNRHPELADPNRTDPKGDGVRGEDSLALLQRVALRVHAREERRPHGVVEPLHDAIVAFDLDMNNTSSRVYVIS